MKYLFSTFMVSIVLFHSGCLNQSKNVPSGNSIQVKIDPEETSQTIEGWGSSLCWWAGQVGNWEESKVDSLIDLFTSPDGLNMNIFRYNIGGGDDPSHIDGHMVKGKGKRAEMEGFKPTEDAPYNWEADKAQRRIMLKIKEKRPDAIFEAFSNSAPYWMTYSGCSAGNVDPMEDNLKPEYYEAFCDYLLDVCQHYKNEYGIEFKTLEPFNESTSGYWNYLGSQEGCHFEPETQMKIIKILYPKLKSSGLNMVISASDETNIKSFIHVLTAYQKSGNILDKIGQLNTHTYDGTNEERIKAQKLVSPTGKEFWQSETGPMGLPRRANGLENNLLLSQKLFDDMRYMKPQAWLDWQLMEEGNDVWGLIMCDFNTQEYTIHKNFYVRMQVTQFFKQGYIMVETNDETVLAATNPENTEWVFAINNTTDSSRNYQIDLNAIQGKIKKVSTYRTSKTENCQLLPLEKTKGKTVEYASPAFSLTTLIINQ